MREVRGADDGDILDIEPRMESWHRAVLAGADAQLALMPGSAHERFPCQSVMQTRGMPGYAPRRGGDGVRDVSRFGAQSGYLCDSMEHTLRCPERYPSQ
jgi:hypothetical protein